MGDRIRFGGRVAIIAIATLLVLSWLFSWASTLVSAANDVQVIVGAVLMLVTLAGLVALVAYCANAMPRIFAALALLMLGGCTRVDPGYVGVLVNLYGENRGVQDVTLVTGRVWYNPWSADVYQFPTFLQQATLDGASAITFNSKESAIINADVFLAYQIEAEKVPEIFVRFRQGIENITHSYVRNTLREVVSRHASRMPTMEIMGEGRATLEQAALTELQSILKDGGIHLESFSFVGGLRVDERVMQSVNAAIAATQAAIQAENTVRQKKAEADQARAEAQGQADAQLIRAKSEAESNRVIAASVTPELIQWEGLRRWNGTLPQVTSGGTPFVMLK